MVDRETAAWDRQDAEALVSLFHPDMVWPWPPDAKSHDPASWTLPQGRYNRERWKAGWQELFRTYELVHNVRKTVRVVLSAEGDGAIAVVDVDTLWRNRTDNSHFHWKGRACKGYTKLPEKLQRNIRRNFHATVSRDAILRLAEHYKEMYAQASSLLPAYVGPRRGRYVDPADVKISQFVAALRKRYTKESKRVVEMIAWYVVHYEYLR